MGSASFKSVEEYPACHFGSNYGGGANCASVVGAVRLIAGSIPLPTLRQLAMRAGGKVVGGY